MDYFKKKEKKTEEIKERAMKSVRCLIRNIHD